MIYNVLAMAQTQIPTVDVMYYRFNDRSVDTIGIFTSTYEEPIAIKANVHPVPRSVYQEQGLDLNKEYIQIFTQVQINDLDRDASSDKLIYQGKNYQVYNEADWVPYNGWNYFKAVRID